MEVKMNKSWAERNMNSSIGSISLVTNALKDWEKALEDSEKDKASYHHKDELIAALDKLSSGAKKVRKGGKNPFKEMKRVYQKKKKAYEDTFKYVKEYEELAEDTKKEIEEQVESYVDFSLIFERREVLEKDKNPDGFKNQFWDTYGFLSDMEENKNKGSEEIFDTYIKSGSFYSLNVSDLLLNKVIKDVKNGIFEGENWKALVKAVKDTFDKNVKSGNLTDYLIHIAIREMRPDLKSL